MLSDDELQRFWQVTADITPAYRDALRLVLLTGQRPGEVIGIRAEEVDIAKAVWRIPAARVKNKRDHIVPLTGEALRILRQLMDARTVPCSAPPEATRRPT